MGPCCRPIVTLRRVKRFNSRQTCPSLGENRATPPPTHTQTPTTNWPAPSILLLKSTIFTASFLGASQLERGGRDRLQPPLPRGPRVATTLRSLTCSLPEPGTALPRRHVLTSTFRATGSKFLEDFQYLLSLISPSGVQKC